MCIVIFFRTYYYIQTSAGVEIKTGIRKAHRHLPFVNTSRSPPLASYSCCFGPNVLNYLLYYSLSRLSHFVSVTPQKIYYKSHQPPHHEPNIYFSITMPSSIVTSFYFLLCCGKCFHIFSYFIPYTTYVNCIYSHLYCNVSSAAAPFFFLFEEGIKQLLNRPRPFL